MIKLIRKIAEPFMHIEISVHDDSGVIDNYVISPGDDYSDEAPEIKLACAELHTPEIVAAYQAHKAEL